MVKSYKIKERKLDARNALLCASIYNANRTSKDKLLKPSDFMPDDDNKKPEQGINEMLLMAEFINSMKGGKDLRKGGGKQ